MPKTVNCNERGLRIGESHGRAKLTDKQVEVIRFMHECGIGTRPIAAKFGISRRTVRDIVTFKTRWQMAIRTKRL